MPSCNMKTRSTLRKWNKMMRVIGRIVCALMLICVSVNIAWADDDYDITTAAQQLAQLKDDINSPAISNKLKEPISKYMLAQARRLKNAGFKVETMRKGEVIVVTLSTDKMFAPNDTVLFQSIEERLKRFLPYLKTPGMFKMILAAHSDDTGSDNYQLHLTEARIMALYDFFDAHGVDTSGIIGYPLGGAKPMVPNDTRVNRSANRRIEIYIIPDTGLISLAEQKRL